MSTAILAIPYRALQKKIRTGNYAIKVPWKLAYALALLASLLLVVYYIVMVNQLIKGAYTIKSANKKIEVLMAQNREAQTHFTESSFLGNTMQQAKDLGFEKTTTISYIQILQNSLAKAK
ncbi:MAG: hypothetical protein A3D44_00620 [Candidatus Staskawiczbacteria bacterium RIFCSPHIGHO2_02_FULL_42_22]|uniref:Uncharacterized protein n=1 Tax=Candidatus Staskawiczbacteria bacterium RIFCSPHIGHO2_02_FULL_42_22 TaxID=1802207 RepID=A0A1G2I1V7_9BACT|nr:MAG: hypothetical protein A3D44_00620 [Candidatus Staskawiczbacteria bacterium RIFCSPHIGHO2_02_FULL_42_22]